MSGVEVVNASYIKTALVMMTQSTFTGPSYYAICGKLEDGLRAAREIERPEATDAQRRALAEMDRAAFGEVAPLRTEQVPLLLGLVARGWAEPGRLEHGRGWVKITEAGKGVLANV